MLIEWWTVTNCNSLRHHLIYMSRSLEKKPEEGPLLDSGEYTGRHPRKTRYGIQGTFLFFLPQIARILKSVLSQHGFDGGHSFKNRFPIHVTISSLWSEPPTINISISSNLVAWGIPSLQISKVWGAHLIFFLCWKYVPGFLSSSTTTSDLNHDRDNWGFSADPRISDMPDLCGPV